MNFKLVASYICFWLVCNSCTGHKPANDSVKDTASTNNSRLVYVDTLESFFQSKGVLVFNATDKNLAKDIRILNDDNTVFATYNLKKNQISIAGNQQALSDFDKENVLRVKYDFFPKEFYPEQSVIQFEYTDISGGYAEIILNNEKQIKKRIDLKDSLYIVEPWKEHLIGVMIDFNPRNNPMHTSMSDESDFVTYENDENMIFIIDEILGDWIKIECAERCGFSCPKGKKVSGWIRWRKGSILLLRFAYSC